MRERQRFRSLEALRDRRGTSSVGGGGESWSSVAALLVLCKSPYASDRVTGPEEFALLATVYLPHEALRSWLHRPCQCRSWCASSDSGPGKAVHAQIVSSPWTIWRHNPQ